MKKTLFLVIFFTVSFPQAFAATYYVDRTAGNDSNTGTAANQAWQYCPGMTGYHGTGRLVAGDIVKFDRADTWTVSGEYGLHVEGGVTYIGDEWGSAATGRAH